MRGSPELFRLKHEQSADGVAFCSHPPCHIKDSHLQEDIAANKDEKRGVGEAKIIVSRSHPGPVKTNLEVLPLFCFPL